MHSFEVTDKTPAEFVTEVSRSLEEHGLDDYVSVLFDGEDIVARIQWMGTTELRFRTRPADGGFRADLQRQQVAPLHAAFQQSFEQRFENVLAKVGATLV